MKYTVDEKKKLIIIHELDGNTTVEDVTANFEGYEKFVIQIPNTWSSTHNGPFEYTIEKKCKCKTCKCSKNKK